MAGRWEPFLPFLGCIEQKLVLKCSSGPTERVFSRI